MIYLPVSEAYAFDYLSILMVKQMKGLSVDCELKLTKAHLCNKLGAEMFDSILRSWDFRQLLNANERVFRMVGLATTDLCKASEVDAANQERYEAKKALQERFWPTCDLLEVKSDRLPFGDNKPTVAAKGHGGTA